jgi:hypothetical protein
MAEQTKIDPIIRKECDLIHEYISGVIKDAPFAPLISMK